MSLARLAQVFLIVATVFGLAHGLPGCGGASTCLAKGTLVSTPRGDIAIQDLEIGSPVWSFDPDSGERMLARVVAVRTGMRRCSRLTTSGGHQVIATADHPFYAPGLRRYVPLATLATLPERSILGFSGKLAPDRIVSMSAIDGMRRVYDITLDGRLHNFLANGVLVHNKSQAFPLIADLVTVENVATGDGGQFRYQSLDGLGLGTAVMLTRDPASNGVAIVHVTSPQAFDALLFASDAGAGHLRLDLPASVMSVDIRVTLVGADFSVSLAVFPMRGGEEGQPMLLEVPREG